MMKVKMYMRPEELKRYKNNSNAAKASTIRDHDSCFEILVDTNQIDLDDRSAMPVNSYFIWQPKTNEKP